ncbi:flagellar hook-associated protein FlgL [Pseudoduganella plicata]|uniref:Flagellar hook-associated protein 3 n=1 Tax=Pseudoduganella plicata TaxID=321984 RepID=A0A4P7BE21_9BURK|nr:flagellar hook-associated protein FlgL [Pseudoduganella plicata]QBQ36433.1 flagellar hook-associated protein 3 [Pseudoduganella plicata]GGY75436.1 flagellar hook-associated protein FlgL [Pseudoduganella plicata]
MSLRISTSMMYDRGTNQLGTLQSNMLKTQMQLSTGRRVLTPADDPVASARALEVTQSLEINDQYKTNRQTALSSLAQVDTTLGTVGELLTDVKNTILYAGNPALSIADREALAVDLEARMGDLLGQANTADGTGGYVFAGYKTNTLPFAQTATGADYYGDQGERELQVGSGRKMAISASGSAIFERNLTGNGTFLTKPTGAGNTGTGIISPGTVTGTVKGHDYTLSFAKDATTGKMQYSVVDVTNGNTPVLPATDYKAGEPITFEGITFDVKGEPAAGDQFAVEPSKNQSVFTSIQNVINALRSTGTGPTAGAKLTNALNEANQNIQNASDNVLSVRASVGARGKELDYLDSAGSEMDIQYQTQVSDLIEVDPIEAASRFAQQTTSLQAAQQTFKTATSLSLFNYIN